MHSINFPECPRLLSLSRRSTVRTLAYFPRGAKKVLQPLILRKSFCAEVGHSGRGGISELSTDTEGIVAPNGYVMAALFQNIYLGEDTKKKWTQLRVRPVPEKVSSLSPRKVQKVF